jgi:hypothetical protein
MLLHQNLNDWHCNGRIGNQFFKVASMIGISLSNQTNWFVDQPWDYNQYFKIQLPISKNKPNAHLRDELPYYHYTPFTLTQGKVYGIEAYLQSEKYFANCIDFIKEFFTLLPEYADPLRERFKDRTHRVAVHVRRTDFIGNGCTPALPLEYYTEAFTHFPNEEFLVFSDDIEWCKQQFQLQGPQFQYQEMGQDILDMYLMSYCKGIIAANSTYSFWSAWFGERPGYKIIFPKGFFGGWLSKDSVPERFTRIGPKFWDEPGI